MSKTAKFESDLLKTNEDVSRNILKMLQLYCGGHHTNVCKFPQLFRSLNSIQFIAYSHCFHRLHIAHYLDKRRK